MTRYSITASIAFAILLARPVVAHAEAVRYTPDKWHTRIYFTVSHMGLSSYGGRFVEYDIQFMFDEDNMENSRIEATVPVSACTDRRYAY